MVQSAAIYVRISDDRLDDMLGVTRQIEDCTALAHEKGWPVGDIYTDDDRSAYSGKPRKDYARMLADIKAGIRDAVIVYDHYRLIRRPMELEEFFLVCDAAGLTEMAQVAGGDLDLSTSDGQFKARILGAVAHKESADKSRRIRRKHLELAQRGRPKGGKRSFGFTLHMDALVPEEAAVIAELAERFLAGDSLSALLRDLDTRGIHTSQGNPWRLGPLKGMLASARISGQREHHRVIVGPATWPAIITPEQTSRIRAKLADPSRRQQRAPQRYLLTGLVVCSKCGTHLEPAPSNGGVRNYRCPQKSRGGCGSLYCQAPALEDFVFDAALFALDSADFSDVIARRSSADSDLEAARTTLDEATARLDQLAADFGAGAISQREWAIAREPLQARADQARQHLARVVGTSPVESYIGNAERLRDAWSDLDLSRRRAILRAILDAVVIGPGRRGLHRFDESRVSFRWRI